MKSWVINLTNNRHPIVVNEIPQSVSHRRNPNEGNCYVSCDRDYVEIFLPAWVANNARAKRLIYPWSQIESVEIYG